MYGHGIELYKILKSFQDITATDDEIKISYNMHKSKSYSKSHLAHMEHPLSRRKMTSVIQQDIHYQVKCWLAYKVKL